MTTEIQNLIDQIRAKSISLHVELMNERMKCQTIQLELESLKSELSNQKIKEQDYLTQLSNLTSKLEEAGNQVVEPSKSIARKDEEIDELVKEIEYCINQLKK
jgi:chromosome segregation ATPase